MLKTRILCSLGFLVLVSCLPKPMTSKDFHSMTIGEYGTV